MRKSLILVFLLGCYWLFIACNTVTPEKYFGIAVLNSNMMHGFAGAGLQREMESPSVKMIDGDINKTAPMKRKEVIDSKIESIEANHQKLKNLKETSDTRDMLQASKALYDFVLPVYKNEYLELAKLYDENAPKENIQSSTQSIHDKYYPTFVKLIEKLTAAGKPFAERNGIKVNWDIQTSPR